MINRFKVRNEWCEESNKVKEIIWLTDLKWETNGVKNQIK